MRSPLAVLLCAVLTTGNLSTIFATPADRLSVEWKDVTAGQAPVSKNFAHPMKAGHNWDTKTPKLDNSVDKAKKRNKRQASMTLTTTSTITTSTSAPAATLDPNRINTSVYKAGLAWTEGSGSNWSDFLPDVGTVARRRLGLGNRFKRLAGSVIGWTYSWGSAPIPGTPLERIEYVPMAWGTGSAEAFAANSANFRAWGVNSLMSFNEPDQGFDVGGSSISPADAAVAHQQIFNATLAAQYRIGSPAVARGGQAWLQQWIAACAGNCAYDFVPLHYYGTDAQDMISYIEHFIALFGKPVWVTEYACIDFGRFPAYVCTAAETEAFETQVLQYMYNNPQVERYAAFGAFLDWAREGNSNALVTTDGRISELGRLYATTT